MNYRLYTPDDYPMVCEWWRRWRWPCVPEDHLPTVGVITGIEVDTCAAWLYRTDSKFALIEFFITNPDVREREGCIEAAADFLTELAKRHGHASVVVMARNPHLIRKLENTGFAVRDRNTDLLLRRV